ncbi:MAG: phosphotransferase [Pirellulaceae bacterium]|nr:phosphotransferase [Pirellulaceae bacterium]
MSDDRLLDLLRHFDLPAPANTVWVTSPHPKTQGFSQSKIWQVGSAENATGPAGIETAVGPKWCLRSWPSDEPGAPRLHWIHQQVSAASSHCSFILPPVPLKHQSGTFLEQADRLWQIEPWATGRNNFHCEPNQDRLASVMRCLAQLHVGWLVSPWDSSSVLFGQWDSFGSAYSVVGPSPGLKNRALQLNRLVQTCQSIFLQAREYWRTPRDHRFGSETIWRSLIERIEQHWNAHLQNCRAPLEQCHLWKLPLGPVLADVWSDHLFFVGDQLSAIIDYGAMRVDSAAADLSRCLLSLCGQDEMARRFALQEYEAVRPLVDSERAAIQVFDQSSRLLGPMHWLHWLFVERRMAPSEIILQRLQCLLEGHPY